jgi:ribonuclease HI
MTTMVADCDAFVSFHGLRFNKGKCEYMVLNQPDCRGSGDLYSEWRLPTWPTGEDIKPKARQVAEKHAWRVEHEDILEQISYLEGGCVSMDNMEAKHLVTSQPCAEKVKQIKSMLRAWEDELQGEDDPAEISKHKRAVVRALTRVKKSTYGETGEQEIIESTESWAEEWQQWTSLKLRHQLSVEQATRYLGVFFNMDLSWRGQRQVLESKFRDLYDRIARTRPTTEMAVYCLNAVVNAALKFPLQVAAMPATLLREWDSKHRGIVKRAAFLPRSTSPELLHLPKREGGKGLLSLEHEIDILRIQTQMRMLNEDSTVGAVVRASKLRHDRGKERGTIQYHTAEALKRWGMHIKCAGLPSGGGITEMSEQARADIRTAEANSRLGVTIHAFGDGATWDKEGVSGWGVQLQKQGGEVITESYGRTPGIQQNDASETFAILQSLLNTHTLDDVELYCDNQGCVDIWNRFEKWQGTGQKPRAARRGNYAAMWRRIESLRRNRMDKGSSTVMNWIRTCRMRPRERAPPQAMNARVGLPQGTHCSAPYQGRSIIGCTKGTMRPIVWRNSRETWRRSPIRRSSLRERRRMSWAVARR